MTALRLPRRRRARHPGRRSGRHRAPGRAGRAVLAVRRLPRAAKVGLLVLLVVVPLLTGGWLWLRDSSLVAVRDVQVVGLPAASPPEVRSAIVAAARAQTTLAPDASAIEAAVARFPVVAGVEVTTDFPHGMRVDVAERRPVAVVRSGRRSVAVSADGMLLAGAATGDLPPINVDVLPAGTRLQDASARRQLAVLAAAPAPLRARVDEVAVTDEGLEARLRDGPSVRLGAADGLRGKWRAATGVLADPGTAGATYVDVRVPERPAVGGLGPLPTEEGVAAGPLPTEAGTAAGPLPAEEGIGAGSPWDPAADAMSQSQLEG